MASAKEGGVGDAGPRASDLLKMECKHVEANAIYVRQDKTEERLRVACPAFLIEYLSTVPRNGKHILATELHQAVKYSALVKMVRRVREKAGLPGEYVMHGWRYTAAVELVEAGASDA